jgi:hypothetical protein
MTEAEWLACTEPGTMLEFLHSRGSDGTGSDRKLRLFACACCRRIWHLLPDKRARGAVEIAERFADRLVEDLERSDARKLAQQVAQSRAFTPRPEAPREERRAASAVYYATARRAMEAAWNACELAVEALVWREGGFTASNWQSIRMRECSLQASALRDIFGNPFRPVAVEPHWLAWNDATVPKLAQQVYDGRRWQDFPVLADALEDAGCDNPEVLAHCRSGSDHVRGCWVLDLLLGKE